MSSRSSPTPSDRQELLFLGKECHHPACHLYDFLPFTCPACHLAFCQPHFLPSHHACMSPLPPSMIDRIAPQCPLCDEVISFPPGGKLDPNEAVESHIMNGTCKGLEGGELRKKAELRARKDRGEVCFRRGCPKVLVVQMKCEKCLHLFCPTHRHSSSHSCTPTPTASGSNTPSGPSGTKTGVSRLLNPLPTSHPSSQQSKLQTPSVTSTHRIGQLSTQLETRSAAAAAALKRANQEAKIPFVKTKAEKRAQDELSSTLQSLKARHDKGLLSKSEEIRYAELIGKKEAARRRGDKGKDGCVVC